MWHEDDFTSRARFACGEQTHTQDEELFLWTAQIYIAKIWPCYAATAAVLYITSTTSYSSVAWEIAAHVCGTSGAT